MTWPSESVSYLRLAEHHRQTVQVPAWDQVLESVPGSGPEPVRARELVSELGSVQESESVQ